MAKIKDWAVFIFVAFSGIGGAVCLLEWLEITPRDVGAFVNSMPHMPHILWLIFGVCLLGISIGSYTWILKKRYLAKGAALQTQVPASLPDAKQDLPSRAPELDPKHPLVKAIQDVNASQAKKLNVWPNASRFMGMEGEVKRLRQRLEELSKKEEFAVSFIKPLHPTVRLVGHFAQPQSDIHKWRFQQDYEELRGRVDQLPTSPIRYILAGADIDLKLVDRYLMDTIKALADHAATLLDIKVASETTS